MPLGSLGYVDTFNTNPNEETQEELLYIVKYCYHQIMWLPFEKIKNNKQIDIKLKDDILIINFKGNLNLMNIYNYLMDYV